MRLEALLLLAAALAMLVLLELRPRTGSARVTMHVAPMVGRHEPDLQDAPSTTAITAHLALVLERPVFTPARRPTRPGFIGTGVPRLSGIVRGPSLSLAIFAAQTDGGRSMLLATGDGVAGWRVARIDMDRVVLVRNRSMLQLQPSYDIARPATPAPISLAQIIVLSQKHTNPQLAW